VGAGPAHGWQCSKVAKARLPREDAKKWEWRIAKSESGAGENAESRVMSAGQRTPGDAWAGARCMVVSSEVFTTKGAKGRTGDRIGGIWRILLGTAGE